MLKDKVMIVTGASGGIGTAICEKLASEGAQLAMLYRGNREAAESLAAALTERFGVQARCYRCELSDFSESGRIAAEIRKDFGRVDCLVNNAGITRDRLILTMREEDYDAVLDTNLKGAFNMIRHVSPLLLRNRGGHIVNISSVSGLFGNAGQSNYSASKAGLIGLTKAVARELAPKGIFCNAVAPGFIETKMTAEPSERERALIDSIPLRRMGRAEEVAEAVAFLLGSSYITGETLRVDGGIAM